MTKWRKAIIKDCSYDKKDDEVLNLILENMCFRIRRAMMCLNDTSSYIRAGFKVGHLWVRQEMSLGVK